MTNKQFWMKADQISESHNPIEEKAEAMAALLKTAYDENLDMIILYDEEGGTRHHLCMNLDDDHPNTIGNRAMLCYTSRRKAEQDRRSVQNGLHRGYSSVQEILNNFFNKAIAGSLLFNCYSMDLITAVNKDTLLKHIPGPHPLPPDFVDVPVKGYPVIDPKYIILRVWQLGRHGGFDAYLESLYVHFERYIQIVLGYIFQKLLIFYTLFVRIVSSFIIQHQF